MLNKLRSLFTTPDNLRTALDAKRVELRDREAAQASAATSFIVAATAARIDEGVAAQHAAAVERAVATLDEAGVSL